MEQGRLELAVKVLKLMLENNDCLEGFLKMYKLEFNSIEKSLETESGLILYRSVMKFVINRLEDLKG